MTNNELKTTRDYSIFKIHPLNRDINENHVKALIKSMEVRIAFTFITCNAKMEIIDGQHRFEALKRLGEPINYIVTDSKTSDMIVHNSVNKTWKLDDYINHYAKADYKSFIDLVKLQKYYKLTFSTILGVLANTKLALVLAGSTNYNQSMAKLIKSGDFSFNKEKLIQRLDKIQSVTILIKGAGTKRSVIGAINFIMNNKNYDHKRMLEQLEKNPQLFEIQRTADDYIELFELIYNYRMHNKVNLRF
jgi:hypothetical protein